MSLPHVMFVEYRLRVGGAGGCGRDGRHDQQDGSRGVAYDPQRSVAVPAADAAVSSRSNGATPSASRIDASLRCPGRSSVGDPQAQPPDNLRSTMQVCMGVDPWVDRGTCPPLLFEVEETPCV